MDCKKCGNKIPKGGKFCSKCGAPVEETKSCQSCGKTINLDSQFCTYCGAKCEVEIIEENQAKTPIVEEMTFHNDAVATGIKKAPTPLSKAEKVAKFNKRGIPTILFSLLMALLLCAMFCGPAFATNIPFVGRITTNNVNLFSIFGTELETFRSTMQESDVGTQLIMKVIYGTEVTCVLVSVITALICAIVGIVKYVKFIKEGIEYNFYKLVKISLITIVCCLATSMFVNVLNIVEIVADLEDVIDAFGIYLTVSNGGIIFLILAFVALTIVFILKRLENPTVKLSKSAVAYRCVGFALSLAVLLLISHLTIFIEQLRPSWSRVEMGNYTAIGLWAMMIEHGGFLVEHLAFILTILAFGVISLCTVNIFKCLFDFFENREISKKTNLFNIITTVLLILSVTVSALITMDSSFYRVIVQDGEGWASIVGIIIPTVISLGLTIATGVVRRKTQKQS